MVVKAKLTFAGITKGKEYRVLEKFGDSIKIALDNGKKAYRSIQHFEVVG